MYEDLNQPNKFRMEVVVPSWKQHLLQRERMTVSELPKLFSSRKSFLEKFDLFLEVAASSLAGRTLSLPGQKFGNIAGLKPIFR